MTNKDTRGHPSAHLSIPSVPYSNIWLEHLKVDRNKPKAVILTRTWGPLIMGFERLLFISKLGDYLSVRTLWCRRKCLQAPHHDYTQREWGELKSKTSGLTRSPSLVDERSTPMFGIPNTFVLETNISVFNTKKNCRWFQKKIDIFTFLSSLNSWFLGSEWLLSLMRFWYITFCYRSSLPSRWCLHVKSMSPGCYMRHKPHKRIIHLLLCQWIQGPWLLGGHWRVRTR